MLPKDCDGICTPGDIMWDGKVGEETIDPKDGCMPCWCKTRDIGLILPVGDMWPERGGGKRLAANGS